MRLKLFLALFLILSIFFLLLVENKGNFTLKLPKINFPSGLNILPLLKNSGESQIEIEFNHISSQKFNLLNRTLKINGTCITPLQIGNTQINLQNKPCKITLYNPSGFILTSGKIVEIDSEFSKLVVNSLEFVSPERVKVGIFPVEGTAFVTLKNLKIDKFEGKLRKFSYGGFEERQFPPCKELKIGKFEGQLKLVNGTVYLTGKANSLSFRCE